MSENIASDSIEAAKKFVHIISLCRDIQAISNFNTYEGGVYFIYKNTLNYLDDDKLDLPDGYYKAQIIIEFKRLIDGINLEKFLDEFNEKIKTLKERYNISHASFNELSLVDYTTLGQMTAQKGLTTKIIFDLIINIH